VEHGDVVGVDPDLSSTFIDDFDRGKTLGGVIREHCFAWKAVALGLAIAYRA
jgi:hypothetical protein